MPESPTTRLGLYRPLNDGSELVNVQTDLNNNWAIVDLAPGFQIVTSSTRPGTPFPGKGIAESDTGRLYYSNGTLPASASWVEIVTTGTSLTLTGTRSITLNGTSNATEKLASLVSGDANNRFSMTADGTMKWGPGTSGVDVQLARTATSTIGTAAGDNFSVGGNLTVTGDAAITGDMTCANIITGAWTAYTPAWSGTGTSLGNGTIQGRYMLIGKTCTVNVEMVFGTTSNVGTGVYAWSLPFTAASPASSSANYVYSGAARGHAANWYTGTVSVTKGLNTARIFSHNSSPATEWAPTVPVTWAAASTNYIHFTLTYEIV